VFSTVVIKAVRIGISMKYSVLAMSVLLMSGLVSPEVRAADLPSTTMVEPVQIESEGWTFTIAPYLWAANLSGKTGRLGRSAIKLNSSFSDTLEILDFSAMLVTEARYDRYLVFGDFMYTKISTDKVTPRGILAQNIDLASESATGFIGMGYSVVQNEKMTVDLVVGARAWYVSTDLTLDSGFLNARQVHDSEAWFDAMVGVRAKYSFTDKIFLTGSTFIGAGEADLDWGTVGLLGYKFNDSVSAVVGYRAIGVDYMKGGFSYDVVQQGPIAALTINF